MNKAFEKILERLEELRQNQIKELCEHRDFTSEMQSMRGHNILQDAKKIVQEVAEEYNGGWILCTIVDHPDNDDDCEVTMLEHGEYIREIGFYTDRWRRASDEAVIEVVAWKEPSTPYQPK